jgi:hypothetical protein
MRRARRLAWLAVPLIGLALAAGCSTPAALARSQTLQMEAMTQYRDAMAAYHEKVKAQMLADKMAELDQALGASLAQAADAEGRVPVAVALEKHQKRAELEKTFRANVDRLDGQFRRRQEGLDRAIDLAQNTLGLMKEYDRLGSLVRSLLVREIDGEDLVTAYEIEGSQDHAGSTSESETSGR